MKYLCFDIGNVLCDVDFTDFLKELNALGVSDEDAWFFLNRIQPLQDVGHTNIKTELRHTFGIKHDQHPKVIEAWNESIQPNKISMKHFHELRDEVLKVDIAILSNIGHEHIAIISSRIGGKFDWCKKHMSCEVGLRKPSRMYYKTFLDENPEFKDGIYVDDRKENLDTGAEYGFYTRHLDTSTMSPDEIERFWSDLKRDDIYDYR